MKSKKKIIHHQKNQMATRQIRFRDDLEETDTRVLSQYREFLILKSMSEKDILNYVRILHGYKISEVPIKEIPEEESTLEALKNQPKQTEKTIAKPVPQIEIPPEVPVLQQGYQPPSSEEEEEEDDSDIYSQEEEEKSEYDEEDSYKSFSEDEEDEDEVKYTQLVEMEFSFTGYDPYKIDALFDTGCTLLLAKEEVFPPEYWENDTKKTTVAYADQSTNVITQIARNVEFTLGTQSYRYDFLQHNQMKYPVIIGNKFWIQLTKAKPMMMFQDKIVFENNTIAIKYEVQPIPKLPWHQSLEFKKNLMKLSTFCAKHFPTIPWKIIEKIIQDGSLNFYLKKSYKPRS